MKTIVTHQRNESETAQHAIDGRLTLLRAAASSSARILLASVFLVSGIWKLHSPGNASAFFAGILPIGVDAAWVLVIALSLAEVAAACLLLLNKWGAALAFVSSLFFLSAFAIGLFFLGEDRPCGCFGDLFQSQTDEWFVLRSLGFLFLSLFVLRSDVPQPITGGPSKC